VVVITNSSDSVNIILKVRNNIIYNNNFDDQMPLPIKTKSFDVSHCTNFDDYVYITISINNNEVFKAAEIIIHYYEYQPL
jgi:hypothetical protein